MTRTYNDIEAVLRLLEEKEKDLELTARIGKELLEQNQGLNVKLSALEVELRSTHDQNTQLRHELQQKTQLLHALTSDEDGSPHDLNSPTSPPLSVFPPPINKPGSHGLFSDKATAQASVERLKRKVKFLEDDNKCLRKEVTDLAKETQKAEDAEAKLVEGVTLQLASVSEESRMLSEELDRVRNEGQRQKDEVDLLMEKLSSAESEISRLQDENGGLTKLVMILRETQDRLTTELADVKERYGEVECLLREAQENLRKVRQKELPSALTGRYLAPPLPMQPGLFNTFGESIAFELESMNSMLSTDSGIHIPEMQARVPHYRKVFETVRSASRGSNSPSPSPLHRMPSGSSLHGSSSSFAQMSTTATLSSSSMQTCRVSAKQGTDAVPSAGYRSSYSSDVPKHLYGGLPSAGFSSLNSTGQSEESDQSEIATDFEDCLYPGRVRDGIPGSPGAKELQAAIARMAKQQHQQPPLTKGEKAIGGYEGKNRGSLMDMGPHRWSMSSTSSAPSVCHALPYGCRTPDSIMSTGSSRGSRSSWRMPEKLQIVKPLEGSNTLERWSYLAKPSLLAALEERPGVKVRGGINDSVTQHTLMDFEEDDSSSVASGRSVQKDKTPIHPGKFFQGTASVYTFTNSTVLHPDNVPCVPPSPMPQTPAAPSSPNQQPTPLLSRRSSVSTATPTFSTALGLAKMLHERGISASSSENDLSGKAHFTSATATPCNSPDESPFSSRSPSPEGEEDMDANPIASLFSSGAELLRRSLGGGGGVSVQQRAPRGRMLKRVNRPSIGSLSRSDRKALAGMKLVEKLERIGLDSLMAYSQPLRPYQGLTPLASTLQVGTMYSRPAVKSPMAQLTSLKSTLRSRSTEGQEEDVDGVMGPSPAKQRPKPNRRRDLGTVPSNANTKKASSSKDPLNSHSPRGTISAIFFGRKGGLM